MGKTVINKKYEGLVHKFCCFRMEEINILRSLEELVFNGVLSEDESSEKYDEWFLKEAELHRDKSWFPSHEKYVKWIQWYTGISSTPIEKRREAEEMVYITPFCRMREVLGLEGVKNNDKFYLDDEIIKELEEGFGSREAALAYLNGLRHAAKLSDNPEKVIQEVLTKFKVKPVNGKEERIKRSMNALIDKCNK